MGDPIKSGQQSDKIGARQLNKDDRFRYLDTAMKRHRYRPDALIEILHTTQELFGFLNNDLLLYVARELRLPPSRVYGVASFYHLFTFNPKGNHTCTICTGTACYVKGADEILTVVEHLAGTRPGSTSPDGRFSLETSRCLGACSLAPIMVFDGRVVGKVTIDQVTDCVKGCLNHGS